MAKFSNYGTVLNVFASGVEVVSTWIDGGYKTRSGTSMSTPHVAGFVAYLISIEGSMTPDKMMKRVEEMALKDKVTGIRESDILFPFLTCADLYAF